MNDLLLNQIAVVTGGTAGIGKAIAQKYAENGAKVIIFGTNKERGEQAVEEINRLPNPQKVQFSQLDVSSAGQVEAEIKKILEEHGKVDILVNNAGITCDMLLMKMKEEDWDRVMEVNVKSCYNTCHALVRAMMKARKGKIINMSSVIGLTGNAGQTNYAASKAAVIGFTKALAKELAPRNINVNCLAPGFIETAMTEAMSSEQREDASGKIPLGRMGQPIEIANAALFLASSWSDYITGQVLAVDGGMVM